MARTIKNEELQAEVTIPEPLTGAHYQAWNEAFYGVEKGDMILRGILGTLAIIEGGFYVEEGKEKSIKDRGMGTDLSVLVWAQSVVTPAVTEAIVIPKPSSPPPPTPPTGKASRQKS